MTPALNRKAVPSSSPGLRRGYPGITNENDHPTAMWLRHFFCRVKKRRNRVAVETSNQSLPRVPEAANPGLEAEPPCGLVPSKTGHHSFSDSLRSLIGMG